MKKRIEMNKYKTITLRSSLIEDICLLPNGYFCFVSASALRIYDQTFNLYSTVINDNDIEPKGIAFNNRNELYISDSKHNCIYMMDFKLNSIKTFGTVGEGNDQFNRPFGLYCKEDLLYVCDHSNKRIQILSLDLEYVDTIKLYYWPSSIKISDSTIGISGSNGTYFYDLKTKELKKKYSHVKGKINKVDSNFYVSSFSNCFYTKFCYYFNKDASLVSSLRMPDTDGKCDFYWWDGCVLFINMIGYVESQIFYCKF
jgi:hypothetical protein